MKKLLLSLIVCFWILSLCAQELSYSDAKQIASELFLNIDKNSSNLKSTIEVKVDSFTTYFTNRDASLKSTQNPVPAFYIFNRNDQPGFAIISADKRAKTILGYSYFNNISEINPGLKVLLNQFVEEISYLKEINLKSGIINYYDDLESYTPGDWLLGNIEWGQSYAPYNSLCPYDETIQNNVPAGCVATSMAQIMYYYKYPRFGNGTKSYFSDYGFEFAPFEETEFQYELMEDNNIDEDNLAIIEDNLAMSTLLYYCGVSVDMNYGPNESSAFTYHPLFNDAHCALPNYFNFKEPVYKDKTLFSWENWYSLIKTEIDLGRPIMYSATDPNNIIDPEDPKGSHSFIIDGYDDNNKFHVNWGWGAINSPNDFFSLTALNPGDYDFKNAHSMLIGIEPANPDITLPTLELKSYSSDVTTSIILTFSEPVDKYTVNPNNLIISDSNGNRYSFSKDYSEDDTKNIIITLDERLPYNENIEVTLTDRIKDLVGNSFDGDKNGTPGPDYTFAFTTESSKCEIISGYVSPSTGTTNDNFEFIVRYKDESGQEPDYIRVNINDQWYELSYAEGDIKSGAYYVSTSQNFIAGTYSYYFEAATTTLSTTLITEPKEFTVETPAYGHDIELQLAEIPTSSSPNRDIEVSVNVRNEGEYTESNFSVDFELIAPDGSIIDSESYTIQEIPKDSFQKLTSSLRVGDEEGYYTVNAVAKNTLDETRSNNSINPKIYVGERINSEEYKASFFSITTDQKIDNAYGQDIYCKAFNNSTVYIEINGGNWVAYSKNEVYRVLQNQYIFNWFSTASDEIWFYFGPVSDELTVEPNPIVGSQGDKLYFTVESSDTDLGTGFSGVYEDSKYEDGELISSWMVHDAEINSQKQKYSITYPDDIDGDYEGWIEFSGNSGYKFYKIINASILADDKDLVVDIIQPASNTQYEKGDIINTNAQINNISNSSESINYTWKLINPQGTTIQQINGSEIIPSNGYITPSASFSTSDLGEETYTLLLEILNFTDDNLINNSDQVEIAVIESKSITANFIASNTTGTIPFSVDFSDLSVSQNTTITSWQWDFNGDGIIDDTNQNPQYTYNNIGDYTISLTVSDGILSSTETKTQYISTVSFDVDFDTNIKSGTSPLIVSFTDLTTSDYPITSWNWNFGDGYTSTDQNPNHTYNSEGSYTVSLIVKNNLGDKLLIKENFIIVEKGTSNNNPTSISISRSSFPEDWGVGEIMASFTVIDPDEGDTHTLIVDNDYFSINSDNQLVLEKALDYELFPTMEVVVTATDSYGATFEQYFQLEILNINEMPIVTSIDLVPELPTTDDDLELYYLCQDPDDGGGSYQSGDLIRWYKDGTLQSSLNDQLIVNNTYTQVGEEWYATVQPQDGNDLIEPLYGAITNSNSVTISEGSININEGLIAYYPFNGNANDESGNGNDGTVNGATLTTDRFGNENAAYSFDGVNDYIDVPFNENLYPSSISISLWLKISSYPESGKRGYIISNAGSGTNPPYDPYQIYIDENGFITGKYNSDNDSKHLFLTSTTSLDLDVWYHIVSIYNDNSAMGYLYINNEINYSENMLMSLDKNTLGMHIGDDQGIDGEPLYRSFEGTIDDISIYNYALSESEITELSIQNNCDNLSITENRYSETSDLNQMVITEFGDNYTIADWNDLTAIEDLDAWATCMGIEHDQTFMVTRSGEYFYGTTRQYYVHYSTDGLPYSGFAVHDQVGNFYLGSWYGLSMNIIAKSDYATNIINTTINNFAIYPNPTKNEVYIVPSSKIDNSIIIKLMDYSGRILFIDALTSLSPADNYSINLSNFGSGLYLISIESNYEVVVKKVIKE